MLEAVKTALRTTTNDADIESEINDLIEACRIDLVQSGVSVDKAETDDPLIKRAIVLYAKANYGMGNPDADRFQQSYELLKQHLSYAGDYNGRNME